LHTVCAVVDLPDEGESATFCQQVSELTQLTTGMAALAAMAWSGHVAPSDAAL